MAVYFECTTRTSTPEQSFLAVPGALTPHQNSMAQSREEAVDGVTSGRISLGEEITWRTLHFSVPLRITSRITEMESPDYFVEEQVRGPFRRFQHLHEFSDDPAGTIMVDRIKFATPFRPLGRLVEKLVLARYLGNLIETRSGHLTRHPSHG